MKAARAAEIGRPGLPTPATTKVQTLQKSLHAKAKAEANYRFYSLWDKVYREDVLEEAWRQCRRNGGAPGVDEEDFERIEAQGKEAWLANLQEELKAKRYAPQPLLRVWIPKANGKLRPLGIPTVRDRVAQAATLLVLQPIFEADLLEEQYGFRPGMDAKMAVRQVYFLTAQKRRTEVVDADLKDYFNAIPHAPLMRCVARRVTDRQVLAVIKQWLGAPVMERTPKGWARTTDAKDRGRGAPQGGVISPLLANLYFRRFALAWRRSAVAQWAGAHLVNYADDFVLCCRPGGGQRAMAEMRMLMGKLGLTVNEEKTRLVRLPEGSFDFLGYTFSQQYGRGGRAFLGTCPSRKSLTRALRRVHDETSKRWNSSTPEKRVEEVNRVLRGWYGYFNQGPVFRAYRTLQHHAEGRLRRWLSRKHKRRGRGYSQYSDEYLYEVLGLFKPPLLRRDGSPSPKA